MLPFSTWAIVLLLIVVVCPTLIFTLAFSFKNEKYSLIVLKIGKFFLYAVVIFVICLIVSMFGALSSEEYVSENESLVEEFQLEEIKLSNDGSSIIGKHNSGIITIPVENCIIENGEETVLKKYLKTVESSQSFFLITETNIEKYDLYRLTVSENIM